MGAERKFVTEKIRRVLLKEFLRKETEKAGFGGLDIQRTPMGTRITLIAERPGMIIGRKGGTIKDLTSAVERDFKFENPQIEVQEDQNPALNPHIMAQKLASAIERGWHFRRAGHSTVRRIMEAGAKGVQVIISGKLTGERHRTEKFTEGHVKYCGEPRIVWMREGFAVAKKKPGIMGIKVRIMDPKARLPDEIAVKGVAEGGTSPVPVVAPAPPAAPPEPAPVQIPAAPAQPAAATAATAAPAAAQAETPKKGEKDDIKLESLDDIAEALDDLEEDKEGDT